jgi:ABC-type glycerol-3-phosphate transport system permease component
VLIVPLFAEMKALGLINTYLGAILPTIASAFGVFRKGCERRSDERQHDLEEDAEVPGAIERRRLIEVVAEMKALGLINTYLGAILPTIASAFGVFLLRQAMSTGKLFQVFRNANTARVASAGRTSGSMIWKKMRKCPAPSSHPA